MLGQKRATGLGVKPVVILSARDILGRLIKDAVVPAAGAGSQRQMVGAHPLAQQGALGDWGTGGKPNPPPDEKIQRRHTLQQWRTMRRIKLPADDVRARIQESRLDSYFRRHRLTCGGCQLTLKAH